MKINGEILKLKTPVITLDVVKDYPGHVLLESEAVKKFVVRAKPLKPEQELKPNKIYFLVELPLFPKEEISRVPRRVKSAVQMSAKGRLECLMLTRRSASDLSISKPNNGPIQLKMKLPRSLVQKLVEEGEVKMKLVVLVAETGGSSSAAANVGELSTPLVATTGGSTSLVAKGGRDAVEDEYEWRASVKPASARGYFCGRWRSTAATEISAERCACA
ncbi:PREDICTED: uncharacterized protein At1g66480-like [Nicotiana attenuata]|uniref:uncharacterized protein At1g66480-like n=1 Tax=Nicotiana attenuata TaxID=49451 RepID=UPI0009057C46|nr:PREDICTED: uncharacterized protein At1g66480-like [Nicotiana attenuata]